MIKRYHWTRLLQHIVICQCFADQPSALANNILLNTDNSSWWYFAQPHPIVMLIVFWVVFLKPFLLGSCDDYQFIKIPLSCCLYQEKYHETIWRSYFACKYSCTVQASVWYVFICTKCNINFGEIIDFPKLMGFTLLVAYLLDNELQSFFTNKGLIHGMFHYRYHPCYTSG